MMDTKKRWIIILLVGIFCLLMLPRDTFHQTIYVSDQVLVIISKGGIDVEIHDPIDGPMVVMEFVRIDHRFYDAMLWGFSYSTDPEGVIQWRIYDFTWGHIFGWSRKTGWNL